MNIAYVYAQKFKYTQNTMFSTLYHKTRADPDEGDRGSGPPPPEKSQVYRVS